MSDLKKAINPLPGITHDFGCTHEAVLCRCYAHELLEVRAERDRLRDALAEAQDINYEAWTIIANVSEGDWHKQQDDWHTAAVRWRDRWHGTLPTAAAVPETETT